jgi:hypothetical protein
MDLRNYGGTSDYLGDLDFSAQTKDGKVIATGGITFKVRGERWSFDERGRLQTKNAGFWKSKGNETFTVSFYDIKGQKAIVKCSGVIRWDKERNFIEGKDNFLRIKTNADPNRWYEITQRKIIANKLCITTESGDRFLLSNFAFYPSFSGAIFQEGCED